MRLKVLNDISNKPPETPLREKRKSPKFVIRTPQEHSPITPTSKRTSRFRLSSRDSNGDYKSQARILSTSPSTQDSPIRKKTLKLVPRSSPASTNATGSRNEGGKKGLLSQAYAKALSDSHSVGALLVEEIAMLEMDRSYLSTSIGTVAFSDLLVVVEICWLTPQCVSVQLRPSVPADGSGQPPPPKNALLLNYSGQQVMLSDYLYLPSAPISAVALTPVYSNWRSFDNLAVSQFCLHASQHQQD